jgi:transcriptional regulator with XRE-family HTH domain
MKSLRKLRREIGRSGLSQREVAKGAGISESALSNILAGRRTPAIRTAESLLGLLRSKSVALELTVENTFGARRDRRAA